VFACISFLKKKSFLGIPVKTTELIFGQGDVWKSYFEPNSSFLQGYFHYPLGIFFSMRMT